MLTPAQRIATASRFTAASDGESYLVVTAGSPAPGESQLNLVLLDGRGSVVARREVPREQGAMIDLELAWGGDRYLLVTSPGSGTFMTRTVSRALEVSTQRLTGSAPRTPEITSMVWVEESFLLLAGGRALLRIEPDGTLLAQREVYPTGYDSAPAALATNGRKALIYFRGIASFVQPDLTLAPVEMPLVSTWQREPRVVSGRNVSLTAWIEWGGAEPGATLRAARLAPGGVTIDSTAIRLPVNSAMFIPPYFDVAAGNGTFLVVWAESGGMRGAIVQEDGTVSAPIVLSDNQGPCVAGHNGSEFLVAWFSKNRLLSTVRLNERGERSAVNQQSVPLPGTEPAIAWNGERFLLAYTATYVTFESFGNAFCMIPEGCGGMRIGGLLLDRDGTILDHRFLSAGPTERHPAVAHQGGSFLIVWQQEWFRTGGSLCRMIGRSLDAGGISPIALIGPGGRPSVMWDGLRFLAVSHDATCSAWPIRDKEDLQLTPLRSDGVPLFGEGSSFAIARTADPETNPRIWREPGGSAATIYQRTASEVPHGGMSQVFIRQILIPAEALPPPPPHAVVAREIAPGTVEVTVADATVEPREYLVELEYPYRRLDEEPLLRTVPVSGNEPVRFEVDTWDEIRLRLRVRTASGTSSYSDWTTVARPEPFRRGRGRR